MSPFWLWIIACTLIRQIYANNGDGFNVYKDFQRARNEDGDLVAAIQDPDDTRMIYFYRTPLYPDATNEFDDAAGQFKKRTVNKFKNMMLNKELNDPEAIDSASKESRGSYIPRIMKKRIPGALLSWAIPTANRFRNANHINRLPGLNRPSAV